MCSIRLKFPWLTDKEIEKYASLEDQNRYLWRKYKDHCIVSNACDYTSASKGVDDSIIGT